MKYFRKFLYEILSLFFDFFSTEFFNETCVDTIIVKKECPEYYVEILLKY